MEVHFSPTELEEAIKYIDWQKIGRMLDPALPYRQEDERRQQQKEDNIRHGTKDKLKKALRRGF